MFNLYCVNNFFILEKDQQIIKNESLFVVYDLLSKKFLTACNDSSNFLNQTKQNTLIYQILDNKNILSSEKVIYDYFKYFFKDLLVKKLNIYFLNDYDKNIVKTWLEVLKKIIKNVFIKTKKDILLSLDKTSSYYYYDSYKLNIFSYQSKWIKHSFDYGLEVMSDKLYYWIIKNKKIITSKTGLKNILKNINANLSINIEHGFDYFSLQKDIKINFNKKEIFKILKINNLIESIKKLNLKKPNKFIFSDNNFIDRILRKNVK